MGFQVQFSLILGSFWGHFGVKRGEKRVPEGIVFLGENGCKKKQQKIETNRAQEGPPIIDPSFLGPRWSLGGRGELTKQPKNSRLIILTRPLARGQANLNRFAKIAVPQGNPG